MQDNDGVWNERGNTKKEQHAYNYLAFRSGCAGPTVALGAGATLDWSRKGAKWGENGQNSKINFFYRY